MKSVARPSSKMGLIADSKLDAELVGFLSRMRTNIHDDADAFVDELVERYKQFALGEEKKEVFISYASEDYDVANRVAETFRRLGMGVWFDKVSLEPGDEYVQKIKKNIEECRAFVPILSQNVLDRGRRFYKREWTWAKEEVEWRGNNRFIFPIRVDDVNLGDDAILGFFDNLHTVDFSEEMGEANIKKIIREVRSLSV